MNAHSGHVLRHAPAQSLSGDSQVALQTAQPSRWLFGYRGKLFAGGLPGVSDQHAICIQQPGIPEGLMDGL